MIEILTLHGERETALSHILEFRNPVTITSLEKFKFEAGKSLNNQDLMFQSCKCWKANHRGSYRYFITQ